MSSLKAVDDAVEKIANEKDSGKFERKIFLYIIAVLLAFGSAMGLRYVNRLETENADLKKENGELRQDVINALQKVNDEKQSRIEETRNFTTTLESINQKLR